MALRADGGARPAQHRAFEDTWRTVEPRLRRLLAARRVPVADHDDYLQEVAARALVSNVPLDSAEDVLRWGSTVLRNLHIDAIRGCRRYELDPEPCAKAATAGAPGDVAAQVVARMDLATVSRAVSTWSAEDRQALLGEPAEGTRASSATYVRRHRLRVRLLAAIDGLAAWWAGVWRRFDLSDSDRASTAVLLPPAALACAVTVTIALSGGGGTDHVVPPQARDGQLAAPALAPDRSLQDVSTISHIASGPTESVPSAPGLAGLEQLAAPAAPAASSPEHQQPPQRQPASSDSLAPLPAASPGAPGATANEDPAPDGPDPVSCYADIDSGTAGPCVADNPTIEDPASSPPSSAIEDDPENNIVYMKPHGPDVATVDVTGVTSSVEGGGSDDYRPSTPCDDLQQQTDRAVDNDGLSCPVKTNVI